MKKKNNKKKIKKRKIVILILIIVLIVGICIYLYLDKKSDNNNIKSKLKVVDSIKKYDYSISNKDTKLFKTKFNELKKVLNKKTVDNKKYSELISELFIIDFFTLDNKLTKNDVGGVQFIFSNYKTSFIDKARDEFYKYVKNNLNDDRSQELPIVSTIKVESSDSINPSDVFSKDELKSISEAYKISLSWTYEKDLGYQTNATLVVVKDGDFKFSIAKLMDESDN
jgi:hypothetical protein